MTVFWLLLPPFLIHQVPDLIHDMASHTKIKNTMVFSFSQLNVSQHVVTEVSASDPTSASVRKAILVLSVNKWTEASAELPGQVFWIRSLTWHLICWISQVTLYSFWDSLNIPSWWAFILILSLKRETILPLHTPMSSFSFSNLKAVSRNVQISVCMLAHLFTYTHPHVHSQSPNSRLYNRFLFCFVF